MIEYGKTNEKDDINMNLRLKFAETLNALISKDGKSVSAIAKEIGISQQALYRYLHQERSAQMEILNSIADYFCVTTDFLLGRSN